ncbi:hypothetical protein QLX55_06820 [Solobacterium moorei]|nr:hypothetical protein [Solobacterium moorei]MDI6415042.1 hypothetical protein [Solobacterium moorei]
MLWYGTHSSSLDRNRWTVRIDILHETNAARPWLSSCQETVIIVQEEQKESRSFGLPAFVPTPIPAS